MLGYRALGQELGGISKSYREQRLCQSCKGFSGGETLRSRCYTALTGPSLLCQAWVLGLSPGVWQLYTRLAWSFHVLTLPILICSVSLLSRALVSGLSPQASMWRLCVSVFPFFGICWCQIIYCLCFCGCSSLPWVAAFLVLSVGVDLCIGIVEIWFWHRISCFLCL